MKKHDVILTARAKRELQIATNEIAKSAPLTAERWFNRVILDLTKLRNNPDRCPVARESNNCPYRIHSFLLAREATIERSSPLQTPP